MERPDGSRCVALVNIRALRDRRGKIQGAINCFQDISDRKSIEEELRRKTQELEDFFDNGVVGLHIVTSQRDTGDKVRHTAAPRRVARS
jgi:transcriptional regulator with PAS, ATPase and Fis domain